MFKQDDKKSKTGTEEPTPPETSPASEPGTPAPTSPAPTAPAPEQDKVVYTKEAKLKPMFRPHNLKVTKLADQSQVFPYLTECTCGFQSRTSTEDNAKKAVDAHLGRLPYYEPEPEEESSASSSAPAMAGGSKK